MAAAVPGFALAEQYKIDPFTGKPFTSLAGGFYNSISPFRIYDAEFPEGTPEALGQSVASRLTDAGWASTTLTTTLDQGEELAADERADFAKELYNVRLPQRLDTLFNSDRYQQALAAFKARTYQSNPRESEHIRLINEVVRSSKAEARAAMLRNSPKWRERNRLVNQRRFEEGRGNSPAAAQIQQAIEALN
jgi:hypothetical protein